MIRLVGVSTLVLVTLLAGCKRDRSHHRTAPDVTVSGSGARFADYIRASPFTSLLVEVDVAEGVAPTDASLDTVLTRLLQRCNKPAGITFAGSPRLDDTIPASELRQTYTVSDLLALRTSHQDATTQGTIARLYILYLNGSFDPVADALGVSFNADAIAIFRDRLVDALGPWGSNATVVKEFEEAVLVHEAGHVMGLVNAPLPMVSAHEDTANRAHDVNPDCVMYFQLTLDPFAALQGTVPDNYDTPCQDDISAGGGLPAGP